MIIDVNKEHYTAALVVAGLDPTLYVVQAFRLGIHIGSTGLATPTWQLTTLATYSVGSILPCSFDHAREIARRFNDGSVSTSRWDTTEQVWVD
jgi:hypothetical protein